MRFLATLLCATLLSWVSLAQLVEDYDFPIRSPHFATVTAALLFEREGGEFFEFEFLPNRQEVLFYEGRGNFSSIVYQQEAPAPVIYVIPGLGGNDDSGTSNWLAEKLFAQGYHVVTLSSPFSWSFSLRASENGVVGFLPDDTRNLYDAIVELEARLLAERDFQITKRGMIGYSLGGLTLTHLMNWDQQLQILNFQAALLINPPVDLKHGIENLHSLYNLGENWSAEQKTDLRNRALRILQELFTKPIEELVRDGVEDRVNLNSLELQYLIGEEFRNSLANILFTTQVVNDQGVLSQPITRENRSQMMQEIWQYDFFGYIDSFLLPMLRNRGEQRSRNQLLFDIGLQGQEQTLRNNEKIFLMHNQDDFLMRPSDTQRLLDWMPGRARIYPQGGHVGNLWHEDNQSHILGVFRQQFQ